MRFLIDPFLIAQWIAASLAGELTEEELLQLEKWCATSKENQRLYDRILDEENQKLQKDYFTRFNKIVGWKGYQEKRIRHRRMTFFIHIARYAAILLLPLGVALYFWMGSKSEYGEVSLVQKKSIEMGSPKAQLILADGQVIDLEREIGMIHANQERMVIHNEENELSYQDTSMVGLAEPLVYHEMVVPRGGEFILKLSDGTVVYLNSMTKIRFPVRFVGTMREVELEGEAYFNVAKKEGKPFIVKTASCDVTVLGTQFNISAYKNEIVTTTTLVKGSVSISGEGTWKPVRLTPNEQFVLDKLTGETEVKWVDVSYSTAWKEGKFRFRDIRLEDIMRVVERWYDVEVFYEDQSVRDLRFGFNVSRHESIDPLLRIFEMNGKVRIRQEGNVLRIKRGR